MASQNRVNGPDSLPVNGTEQQRTDLFQNLEKLIASAVSICRLDGSVQCQIGGLITVIEELQRLLRHSFAEIRRLERNLDDQEHTFTNNITNLHYQVNEVQSAVETLECDFEEAQRSRETSSAIEQSSQNETELDDSSQISSMEESCGYGEKSDGGAIPNNVNYPVENTAKDKRFTASSEKEEGLTTMPDSERTMDVASKTDTDKNGEACVEDDGKSDGKGQEPLPSLDEEAGVNKDKGRADNGKEPLPSLDKDDGEKEKESSADHSQGSSVRPNKETGVADNGTCAGNDPITSNVNGGTNDLEQSHEIPSSSPPLQQDMLKNNNTSISPHKETGTSTSKENALRVLRSNTNDTSKSDNQEQVTSNKKNQRYFSNRIEAIETRSSSSASKDRLSNSPFVVRKSPKIQSSSTFRSSSSPKTSLSDQDFDRNPAKNQKNQPRGHLFHRSPTKHITSKMTKKNMVSRGSSSKMASMSKIERKNPVSVKLSGKSPDSGSKKITKIVAKSPAKTKNSPLKQRSVVAKRPVSPTNAKTNKDLKGTSESFSKETKSNQSFTAEQKDPKKVSSEPVKENPMDKYIDLDFLLNANQLMSELVTDSSREEGTLDTASEAERRHIVDLAKLYRLRLRMVAKEGDLPVALIKGRESSLPKPGQVDRLLHKMTRAMAIKTQLAKSKESAKKHSLSGNRRSMASPAKKKRV